jgi:hypothetical protein
MAPRLEVLLTTWQGSVLLGKLNVMSGPDTIIRHNNFFVIQVLILYDNYCIIIIIWIGVQFRALPPGSTAASVVYCTIPIF